MNKQLSITLAVIAVVIFAGCGGNTGELNQENRTTPASPTPVPTDKETTALPEKTDEPTPEQTATTRPQTQTPGGSVAAAAETFRIQYNQTDRWQYRGETGNISVKKANGKAIIVVESDEYRKRLNYNVTDPAETRSWSQDNLRFVVRPVNQEQRDGQSVYVFGDTWDTDHVELEIFCTHDC